MVASKLQLNCSGLLSTRPDISSPRTAFVAYPGSGSTYIRWTCDFLLFEIDFLNGSLQKGYDVVWWSFTTTTQHHSDFRISRSSLLLQTDMIFVLFLHWQWQISPLFADWCWNWPLARPLWWGRLEMVGFQFLHLHQLCLQISVSSARGFISWLIFPFLEFPEGCFLSFTHHTALDSGNRDYTQQKAPISPYYRFSNLWVWSENQNWTSSDFLTCSTIVDAAFFLSEIHSSPSFHCSGLEEFFLTITQPWNRNEKKSQNPRIQIWIAGTKSSATTRSQSSREKDTIRVPRKTQRWTQLNYS